MRSFLLLSCQLLLGAGFLCADQPYVRGVVVDSSGRAIHGARVECAGEAIITGLDGRFQIPSVQQCRAVVSAPDFETSQTELTAQSESRVQLSVAGLRERIVVSATRHQATVEEAGVAATVLTADDLARSQSPMAADLLRQVPGLQVVETGQRGGLTSLYTRGSQRTGTLVLLDGVPLNDPGGEVNLANLAQRRHRARRGRTGAGERGVRSGSRRRRSPIVHPPGRPGEHGAEGRPLLRARQPGNRCLAGTASAAARVIVSTTLSTPSSFAPRASPRTATIAARPAAPTSGCASPTLPNYAASFAWRIRWSVRPDRRPTASSIRRLGRQIATPACRCASMTPAAATSCNSFPSATIGCATCTPTRPWKVRTPWRPWSGTWPQPEPRTYLVRLLDPNQLPAAIPAGTRLVTSDVTLYPAGVYLSATSRAAPQLSGDR